jgi:uncharacterized protein (DUF1800 family)
MERRSFLLASGSALLGTACANRALSTPASMPQHTGLSPTDAALLNRVTWGIDSQSALALARLSRRDYLGQQLHPPASAPLPDQAQAQIDAMNIQRTPMPALVEAVEQRRRDANAAGDDAAKQAALRGYREDLAGLAREAGSRMLLRALYSPHQLQEQMTWFWFNHFNVHQYKADLRAMVGDYEDTVCRPHALGRFRDLLIGSATHAAMLRYLDNAQNAFNHLNENYAREVMELHTLGVDGGYTQKDVQELARVLTGLGVNFTDKTPRLRPALQAQYVRHGGTEFNPARHDPGQKLVLGQAVDDAGWDEILGQLTRLAQHPATARHVCRQIAVYMVADQPPPALVERMRQAFVASDGDIAITLQAMFDAPDFNASLTHKFKDPVHFVVSAVRLAYDGKPILNPDPMLGWLNRLGQGLYNRQTPDGYPMDAQAWSGSGQMSTRFEIARGIGAGNAGLFRQPGPPPVDLPAFPQPANALYYDVLQRTLGAPTRAALDAAANPAEWNLVLLSSPEFMFR